MPNTYKDRILALLGASQRRSPDRTRVTLEICHIPSLMYILRTDFFNPPIVQPIDIKCFLGHPDCRDIELDPDVRCTSESTRVQNAIAVDQDDLGDELSRQTVEEDLVDGDLLEGQEARDVGVVDLDLIVMVFIDDLEGGVAHDDDHCYRFFIIVLGIADVDCAYELQGFLWVLRIDINLIDLYKL